MKALYLLLCIAVLALCGCSTSTPSERAVRKLYEQKVQSESQGSIRLVNFEKVNGQSMEFAGVKAYTFEFKGTVEFLEDGWWSGGGLMWDGNFYFAGGNPSQMEMLLPPYVGTARVKKGSHTEVSGKLEFTKTEKGWRTGKMILGEAQDPGSLQRAILRQGALTGDVRAQMNLGTIYKTGDGVPKDLAEAQCWFQMASSNGDSEGAREAALISMDAAATQNRALRAQAQSLRAQADSQTCLDNLKQIGIAARIWQGDNGGVYPKDFLSMSNEISNPQFLHCPADTNNSIPIGIRFPALNPAAISYRILLPGIEWSEQAATAVYVRCPIHGHSVLVNGNVIASQ